MTRKRIWTDSEDNTIREYVRDGFSMAKAAKALGCNRTAIKKCRRILGVLFASFIFL